MPDRDAKLVTNLLRFAEQGVQFHVRMSANPEPKEGFVRDWVAAKLHKGDKRSVAIEVNRQEFRDCVADPAKRNEFDIRCPKQFQVDMIIWTMKPDDRPYALVELQRPEKKIDKIKADLERTSKLLTFCRPGVSGYQVLCAGQKGEQKLRSHVDAVIAAISSRVPQCSKVGEGSRFQVTADELDPTWCQIIVFQVDQNASGVHELT